MSSNDPHHDPHQIVRSFSRPNSPTGEGLSFVTADGKVWHPASGACGTGEVRGELRQNRIVLK